MVVLRHDPLVGDRGRGGCFPWHPPPGQERDGVERIDEAGDVPDARQTPPPGAEGFPGLLEPPSGAPAKNVQAGATGARSLDVLKIGEPEEVHGPRLVEGLLRDPLEVELPAWHHADGLPIGLLDPQAAGPDVRLNVHRVELVPLGGAKDGLETPEQGLGFRALGAHAAPPCFAGPRLGWNSVRTSWEFR